MNKRYIKMLSIVALIYVCLVAGLYLAQRRMIYIPDQRQFTPAQTGRGDIEVVHAKTEDGLSLGGWYRPPSESGKPVIVLFHGNADHHAMAFGYMAPHADHGYGILMTEYRGYAGNPGKPTEQGLYRDGRAWVKWLQDEANVKAQDIVLYGQSLGTGIAVQMATEFPEVRALVLFAPFTSLPDVAKGTYFFVPVELLMRDRYESIGKVGHIKMPVFIINGLADRVVPPDHGKRLYDAAPGPKSLVQIDGGGHNDIPAPIVAARVEHFLDGLR